MAFLDEIKTMLGAGQEGASHPGTAADTAFGPIMDLAGKMRSSNPAEAARLDRYAQGISTRSMPGYSPMIDLPMNIALAAGYEGVKGLPESIGNPILERLGYGRKKSGQATSPASLGSVMALYRGLRGD
jgi:hypothetical protein